MRLTSSRTYYRPSPPKMPPGLVELMEGLTKEVLKHNPSDIHGFCASHMQQLLDKRDGPSPIKTKSLEEKIASAQAKVRRRAESRRQEYDKNVTMQLQNNNVTDNVVKTDLKLDVPKDSRVVIDKDNDELAQNIVNTPIHQVQVLKDSGEIEISHDSRATVPIPTEDGEDKEKLVNVQEVETANPHIFEKYQSATATKANQQNESTVVNNSSSNTKPDDETVKKDLIRNNIYEASKFLNAANQIHEDQDKNLIKNEEQKVESAEHESEKSFNGCDVYNGNVENITDLKDSKQAVEKHDEIKEIVLESFNDKPDEVKENLSESFNDKPDEVKENLSESFNDKPGEITVNVLESLNDKSDNIKKSVVESYNYKQMNIDNFNDNEKVAINDAQKPPPEAPTDLVNINDSIRPNNTDDNVKQLKHTEDVQLSAPIDDVQRSNDIDNSVTDNNILSSDHSNVDGPADNNFEISQELIETDSQGKFNDVKELNNTTNSDKVRDQHEQIENIVMETNDTMEQKKEPQMSFRETDLYSDIQTLVNKNSVNDTDENKDVDSGVSQLKRITSLDNMFEDNEKKSNLEQISTEDVCDHTEHCDKDIVEYTEKVLDVKYENELKTDDTNLDKISTKIHENNQNENQGTNMDLETAAITIQKVFRNFLFKSRGSTFEDTVNDEGNFMDEENKAKEEYNFAITNSLNTDRRAHGITRMDTVLQTVNEEKSLSLSTDDSSTLSSAATVIQAHVRGFLVRNKLNSNKTVSFISVAASNSNEPFSTSIEAVSDQSKNKNVLNIHIVPEEEDYLSRDESLITSMDLSLDSPPSSINLHPLGYDKSERRKLQREDAIQSISPPSNNSGKFSEDLDSVKELPASGQDISSHVVDDINKENNKSIPIENALTTTDLQENETIDNSDDKNLHPQSILTKKKSLTKTNSDENDVVTPFVSTEDLTNSKLTHSGEFHEAVLPTKVSRSDTSVVSGE